MEHQILEFFRSEMKSKVVGEAFQVAGDGFIELSGSDAVETGEIGIEQHALAARDNDALLDQRDGKELGVGARGHERYIGTSSSGKLRSHLAMRALLSSSQRCHWKSRLLTVPQRPGPEA